MTTVRCPVCGSCSGCENPDTWCFYDGGAPREPKQPAAPDTNPLRDLLEEAIATVAARGKPYGGVEDNFDRIARFWTAHLANRYNAHAMLKLDGTDVALMMVLLKAARLANQPDHRDSWVDIAGYAACGGAISKKAVDSV